MLLTLLLFPSALCYEGSCYSFLADKYVERTFEVPAASAVFFFNHSNIDIHIDTGDQEYGPYHGEEIIGMYYQEQEVVLKFTTLSEDPILFSFSISKFDITDCIPYVTNDRSFANVKLDGITQKCILSATCDGFISGVSEFTTANAPVYLKGNEYEDERKVANTNFTSSHVKGYFFAGGLDVLTTHIITGQGNLIKDTTNIEVYVMFALLAITIVDVVFGWFMANTSTKKVCGGGIREGGVENMGSPDAADNNMTIDTDRQSQGSEGNITLGKRRKSEETDGDENDIKATSPDLHL